MVRMLIWAVVLVVGLHAQERPVPSDSEQVSLPGCAKGRTFVVAEGPDHEPKQVVIAPGRRFRLAGSKEALDGIKRREGQLIEVTGLVRKAAISPSGISIAGGRIRLGGAVPRQPMNDPARDPAYNQAVIDVSSWRLLDEQRALVDQCRAIMDGPAGGYVPTVRGGGKMRVRMTCLGRHWNAKTYTYEDVRGDHDGQPVAPLPEEWVALASRLAADAGFVARPDICLINWYGPEGRMGLHQDKDEGADSIKAGVPVVSISLGDTARFQVGGWRRPDPVETYLLESGDVFVFGGPSRLRYHGVTRILPASGPSALHLEGRFNLTFRKF